MQDCSPKKTVQKNVVSVMKLTVRKLAVKKVTKMLTKPCPNMPNVDQNLVNICMYVIDSYMEAAGIEPASENDQLERATCLSGSNLLCPGLRNLRSKAGTRAR